MSQWPWPSLSHQYPDWAPVLALHTPCCLHLKCFFLSPHWLQFHLSQKMMLPQGEVLEAPHSSPYVDKIRFRFYLRNYFLSSFKLLLSISITSSKSIFICSHETWNFPRLETLKNYPRTQSGHKQHTVCLRLDVLYDHSGLFFLLLPYFCSQFQEI